MEKTTSKDATAIALDRIGDGSRRTGTRVIVGENGDELSQRGTRALADGLLTGLHRGLYTLAAVSHGVAPQASFP